MTGRRYYVDDIHTRLTNVFRVDSTRQVTCNLTRISAEQATELEPIINRIAELENDLYLTENPDRFADHVIDMIETVYGGRLGSVRRRIIRAHLNGAIQHNTEGIRRVNMEEIRRLPIRGLDWGPMTLRTRVGNLGVYLSRLSWPSDAYSYRAIDQIEYEINHLLDIMFNAYNARTDTMRELETLRGLRTDILQSEESERYTLTFEVPGPTGPLPFGEQSIINQADIVRAGGRHYELTPVPEETRTIARR